jgi:hypothetical protein
MRAVVEALARKDEQELDRLNGTCPRKTYVCDDWAYHGRLRDLWILAMNHALDIQRLGLAILVLFVTGLNAESKADESAQEDLSEKVERLGGRLLAHLEAWRRFCAELGIDGDPCPGGVSPRSPRPVGRLARGGGAGPIQLQAPLGAGRTAR